MVDGLQLFIILNILIIAFEIYYGKDEYLYIYIYIYINGRKIQKNMLLLT